MEFRVIDLLKKDIRTAFLSQNVKVSTDNIIVGDNLQTNILDFHVDYEGNVIAKILSEQLSIYWKDKHYTVDNHEYKLDINTIDVDVVEFLEKCEATIRVKYIIVN